MQCPLCRESVADENALQVHYLMSCLGYLENTSTSQQKRALPSKKVVQFRWVKTKPTLAREVYLISSLAGSVKLEWRPIDECFLSEQVEVSQGLHVSQLIVDGDAMSTDDFNVSETSRTIDVMISEASQAEELTGNTTGGENRDSPTQQTLPLNERDEQDGTSEVPKQQLPPPEGSLYHELIKHQILHGDSLETLTGETSSGRQNRRRYQRGEKTKGGEEKTKGEGDSTRGQRREKTKGQRGEKTKGEKTQDKRGDKARGNGVATRISEEKGEEDSGHMESTGIHITGHAAHSDISDLLNERQRGNVLRDSMSSDELEQFLQPTRTRQESNGEADNIGTTEHRESSYSDNEDHPVGFEGLEKRPELLGQSNGEAESLGQPDTRASDPEVGADHEVSDRRHETLLADLREPSSGRDREGSSMDRRDQSGSGRSDDHREGSSKARYQVLLDGRQTTGDGDLSKKFSGNDRKLSDGRRERPSSGKQSSRNHRKQSRELSSGDGRELTGDISERPGDHRNSSESHRESSAYKDQPLSGDNLEPSKENHDLSGNSRELSGNNREQSSSLRTEASGDRRQEASTGLQEKKSTDNHDPESVDLRERTSVVRLVGTSEDERRNEIPRSREGISTSEDNRPSSVNNYISLPTRLYPDLTEFTRTDTFSNTRTTTVQSGLYSGDIISPRRSTTSRTNNHGLDSQSRGLIFTGSSATSGGRGVDNENDGTAKDDLLFRNYSNTAFTRDRDFAIPTSDSASSRVINKQSKDNAGHSTEMNNQNKDKSGPNREISAQGRDSRPSYEVNSQNRDGSRSSHEISSQNRDTRPSHEISSQNRDTRPSHEISSQNRDSRSSHEISSQNRDSRSSHEVGSQNRDSRSSHEVGSQNKDSRSSHEISSQNRDSPSSREISSQNRDSRSSHEISSLNRDSRSSHGVGSQNKDSRSSNEISSQNRDSRFSHEISSQNSDSRSNHEISSQNRDSRSSNKVSYQDRDTTGSTEVNLYQQSGIGSDILALTRRSPQGSFMDDSSIRRPPLYTSAPSRPSSSPLYSKHTAISPLFSPRDDEVVVSSSSRYAPSNVSRVTTVTTQSVLDRVSPTGSPPERGKTVTSVATTKQFSEDSVKELLESLKNQPSRRKLSPESSPRERPGASELGALKQKLAERDEAMKKLKAKNNTYKERIEELLERTSELTKALSLAEKSKKALREQEEISRELENALGEKEKQYAEMVRKMEREIHRMESEFEQKKKEYEKKVRDLRKIQVSLEEEVKTLRENSRQPSSKYSNDYKELLEKCHEYAAVSASLKDQIKTLEKENKELKEKLKISTRSKQEIVTSRDLYLSRPEHSSINGYLDTNSSAFTDRHRVQADSLRQYSDNVPNTTRDFTTNFRDPYDSHRPVLENTRSQPESTDYLTNRSRPFSETTRPHFDSQIYSRLDDGILDRTESSRAGNYGIGSFETSPRAERSRSRESRSRRRFTTADDVTSRTSDRDYTYLLPKRSRSTDAVRNQFPDGTRSKISPSQERGTQELDRRSKDRLYHSGSYDHLNSRFTSSTQTRDLTLAGHRVDFSPTSPDPSPRSGRRSSPGKGSPFAPDKPQQIDVGMTVLVTRHRGGMGRGKVKYVGYLPDKGDSVYVGIELHDKDGKHDGTFNGQRFFKCKQNHGVFVPFDKIVMAYTDTRD